MAATNVLPTQSDDSLESKRRQHAPVEGPSPDNAQGIDPCNSGLEETDPDVVKALRAINQDLARQSLVARRWQIRRVRRSELYWQSLQYLWVNPVDQQLYTPTEARIFDDSSAQDQPRYQFVTNIYQAYGLSFIAVISQDIPNIAFYPEDPNDEEDVTAAKSAQDVAELIQRNNDPEHIFWMLGYHAWTGGLFGAYVRYVTDGQKFGWDYVDDMESEQVMLSDGGYVCSSCGAESPMENATGLCPQCGAPLTDENVKAPDFASVPIATNQMRLPRGQEVISIYGALDMNTPIWADEQSEFPYTALQFEVPKSRLKAAYPWAADKITNDGNVLADDQYARVARISVKESLPQPVPSDLLYDLITFTRTWIRPWVYETVKDKTTKQRMYELFPDGCYVAFAGGAYCESRNESMDEHWVVRHAMPGRGQNRPAIGDTLMDVQDQVNTERNICMETWEYGIPPMYADSQVLDFDALQSQTAEPGVIYPARAQQGQQLSGGFFQPQPSVVNPQMMAEIQELCGPLAQLLTGMYPALFGGDTGSNDTAKGITIQRDQAMGRVGLPWKSLKETWCKMVELAVKCFRDNRTDDVALASKDPAKKPKTIRLADLKGNFKAYAEADTAYPRLQSEQRASVERLLAMAKDIPQIMSFFQEPENVEQLQRVEGLVDFTSPQADSRDKQMQEIEEMLESKQPIPILPLDRDAYEFAECQRWASADAGIQAEKINPLGYQAVMQHAAMHQQRMAKLAAQAQQNKVSESIQIQNLPPAGQIQMAQQAGISLTPQDVQEQDLREAGKSALKSVVNSKLRQAAAPAGQGQSGNGGNSGEQPNSIG